VARARLIAGVALLQLIVAAALGLSSLQNVRAWTSRHRRLARRALGIHDGRCASVVWAIDACDRRITGASCLINAIVAEMLLETTLAVGVKREADGTFAFHAWTQSDGRIVVGGPGASAYSPLVGAELARPYAQ
jgi:hypothetical protein